VANIPHWGGELGVRIVPLGRRAYERPLPRYFDPWRGAAGVPATTAEAERLRLERERLEAERRWMDEAQRRTEQERWAQMTEEERRRAALEVEEAQRRIEEEAAGREAAEADAVRAREEAERARADAAAAEQRAREAEERLYQSLLDLDQLIANITAIRETERGLTIVLGQGLFAVGQHTLSPRARDEVGRIASVLMQYPGHSISVEGHTDSTGSEALNQRLSEQRASSVQAALIAEGIDPGRVSLVGFGQNRPIADNATVGGRAENRRVEIMLLGARRPGATQ
jgi:outer membrane protein OmpA-like peptidoglycan-associated protein